MDDHRLARYPGHQIAGVEIGYPYAGAYPGALPPTFRQGMPGGMPTYSPQGMGFGWGQGMPFHPMAPPPSMPFAVGPGGVAARQSPPSNIKRYILPLSPTPVSVAATSTASVTVNSQRAFRVERLILQTSETGGAIASAMTVTQLDVGAIPQLAATGGIPVPVFAAQAVFSALRGDTAVPGKTIAITFSNPTAAAVTVSGAFIGESLEL